MNEVSIPDLAGASDVGLSTLYAVLKRNNGGRATDRALVAQGVLAGSLGLEREEIFPDPGEQVNP